MTAPIDEARLRELAEAVRSRSAWRLSRTRRYVMDGWGSPWVCEVTQRPGWEDTAAFIQAASPSTILALLDALSAERERGADMQRRLDMWEPKPTPGSSIAVSSRIGGNNAPLATQKAEGA